MATPMACTVPLPFHVTALNFPSFASPPWAAMPLSMIFLASAWSSARAAVTKPNAKQQATAATQRICMRHLQNLQESRNTIHRHVVPSPMSERLYRIRPDPAVFETGTAQGKQLRHLAARQPRLRRQLIEPSAAKPLES